jgi:hypothetical protein
MLAPVRHRRKHANRYPHHRCPDESYVVRAFVQLRDLLASNKELAQRFTELERRLERKLATHDRAIAGILDAIRQLMTPPDPPKRPIGFVYPTEKKSGS